MSVIPITNPTIATRSFESRTLSHPGRFSFEHSKGNPPITLAAFVAMIQGQFPDLHPDSILLDTEEGHDTAMFAYPRLRHLQEP